MFLCWGKWTHYFIKYIITEQMGKSSKKNFFKKNNKEITPCLYTGKMNPLGRWTTDHGKRRENHQRYVLGRWEEIGANEPFALDSNTDTFVAMVHNAGWTEISPGKSLKYNTQPSTNHARAEAFVDIEDSQVILVSPEGWKPLLYVTRQKGRCGGAGKCLSGTSVLILFFSINQEARPLRKDKDEEEVLEYEDRE